ncbi:ABC transporter substrate-binding protein [Actinotalea sp. K2]|uniref:ABC transporter substrate-binding protein n=1 Tax=Actinotalea sp. K2 TaxID=2939438 RepID=UPI002016E4AB|nr:extracellular solute-binding protein [Actinotalea sp. K2]MCL3860834.1 extracellular solute-binding protein [Actinotalea sp. K2]
MHPRSTRRLVALTATTLAGALALTACGNGDGPAEEVAEDDFEAAMTTDTSLTFWTWVPDIQNQVDMFMEEYPAIDVEVVNVGQGADHYQQMRTALEAGSGFPDVTQIEFQYISSFRLGDNLLDLAPYVGDLSANYPEWVWSQVTVDDALYAIPQDTGPLGLLYREDLFAEAGIEVPTTWEEYAEAARTYREANPDGYITNMPGNDPGQFAGFMWQAGARPFGYDGEETVRIDLMSPEVQRVTQYWQDLIQEDLVAVDPDFTDQWYQGLANGVYASWPTAAWAPVFLQGTAGNTSGLWRATEIPQWEEGQNVSGNWGGSTNAVLSGTENPIAAAELARWINVEREPALRFANEQFLFPPSNEILQDADFLEEESEFYGGEQVNRKFAEISETVEVDFEWLPFMDYVYSSFGETVGSAIADRGDMMAALQAWNDDVIQYAESQGFTVE